MVTKREVSRISSHKVFHHCSIYQAASLSSSLGCTFVLKPLLIELRNRVYDYCLPRTDDRPLVLSHTRQSKLEFSPERRRHLTRPYLGLTQVSQVIRAEFLPLHNQTLRPWNEFKNVSKHLGTFPLSDPEINQKIMLILGALKRIDSDLRQPLARAPGVDILPFLKLGPNLSHINVWVGRSPLFDVLNCLGAMFLSMIAQSVPLVSPMTDARLSEEGSPPRVW